MTTPFISSLRNVAALFVLIENVNNRHIFLPGLSIFHGPSGFGKTTAVTLASNEFDALVIQVLESDNKTSLCEMILEEMGVTDRFRNVRMMVKRIGQELARANRPLILDDAQYLLKKGMIETVRDIHEASQATIVLVGEEELPHKITRWPNIHGRVREWMRAEPCEIRDAELLADVYANGVDVADDLLERIVENSQGSIRYVSINLERAKELARSRGKRAINSADWGDRPFHTGQPPQVRRLDDFRPSTPVEAPLRRAN